jgi:hypothetical protein
MNSADDHSPHSFVGFDTMFTPRPRAKGEFGHPPRIPSNSRTHKLRNETKSTEMQSDSAKVRRILWANYGGEEMNRLAAGVLKGKEKPQSELRLGKEQSEARQDEGFGGLSPAVRAEYTTEARLNLSTSYINLKAGETILVLINWNDPRIPTDEILAIGLKLTRLMREVQPQAETTIQRLAFGLHVAQLRQNKHGCQDDSLHGRWHYGHDLDDA